MAARVKELGEELTRAAGERDALLSWVEEATVSAKAVAAQLGEERGAHALTKGALDEALKAAEASRVDALAWKEKYEGEFYSLYFTCFSCVRPLTPQCGIELEKEASRATEASRVKVQRWKEKTKGESRRALPLSGLFFLLRLTPSCLFWRRVGEGGFPGG